MTTGKVFHNRDATRRFKRERQTDRPAEFGSGAARPGGIADLPQMA